MISETIKAGTKKEPYKRLAEINRAITTSLNFDQVLDLIVKNATDLFDAQLSLILLVDAKGLLRVRASYGVDKGLFDSFSREMEEDVIKDLHRLLNLTRDDSLVSVPVIAQRSLTGLLVIARHDELDAEEQWQLSALADQAAIALRNAKLYEMELEEANREREQMLTALQASNARITGILESITDLFYSLDRKWRFVEVNRQTELRLGKKRDELLGKVIWNVFPAARQSLLYKNLHQALEENTPLQFEFSSKTIPDVWFEAHVYPSAIGLSVYLRDITARRKGEVTRRLMASIVESSTDAIISKDLNGIMSSWNDGAERTFGYTAEEAVGKSILMLIPDDRLDEEPKILDCIRSGKSINHYETIRRRKDGQLIDISLSVSPIKDEAGVIVGASKIARDITERKRSRTEILFQARLLNAVKQAVIATNLEGTVIYWNAFAEKLYGWTTQEAMGVNVVDLVPARKSKKEAEEIFSQLKQGRSWSGEMYTKRKDGTEFLAKISDSPILNDQGEFIGVVGISVDVTEARQVEEERARLLERERIARAEAEAANRLKDEFLATLSHELRNPLNVVIGYAEILRRAEGAQEGFVSRAADVIKRNALAQSQLVSDLLDLSRLQMGKLTINRESASLSTIVTDAIETVKEEALAKNITLAFRTSDKNLMVHGDPVRLGQIIWNLLNNAVKFTAQGGKITIQLAQQGHTALLKIKDSGQGIPPSFLPHVFEIFRQADASSSRKQGGLGIGLALVKQLAELHGGSVAAESDGIGQGATFKVTLPLQQVQTSSNGTDKKGTTGILRKKFILVVDDSPETTEMLSKLLQMEGAYVKTARSGFEALSLAESCSFDLVISDISMPEMDGYELLRGLRKMPHMNQIPALALTGFGRRTDIDRARQAGFAEHFTKPIDIDKLLETVRKLT